MPPDITVVIPTYNRAELLRRSIASVRRQTYGNLTIFVCDNASTDATQSMVADLARQDPRIQYHRQASNIGPIGNGLFALQQVRTPFFLYLSDDDLMLPDLLSEAMSWFDRYPEAQFVAGGTLEATHGGKLVFSAQAYWPREGFFKPPDGLDLLLGGLHPSWTTTVYRTGVFDLVGPPDQSLPNRLDLDFTLRIACRYPFVVFRKPSGIFVRHRSQYGESIAAKIVSQYEAMIEYYESIDGLDPVTKEILRKGLERHMVKCVQQVAVKELLRGEAAQALQTLDSYHDRGYRREPLSSFISSVAVAGKLCPPALGVLRPLETLRRAVQARSSRAAARRNGLQAGKIDEALAFLKS